MIKKSVNVVRKVGEDLVKFNLSSDATVIDYNGVSVSDTLDVVVESIDNIESALNSDSVFMKDKEGNILTDENGLGLVELL